MTGTHPTAHYKLQVSGMSCGSCATHVKRALLEVEGVSRARVDLESGSAMVGGEGIDPDQLVEAVAEAGYEAAAPEPTEAPDHPGSAS